MDRNALADVSVLLPPLTITGGGIDAPTAAPAGAISEGSG